MIITKSGADMNEPPGTPWYVAVPVTCPRCGVEFSLEATDEFASVVYGDYQKNPVTLYFTCPNQTCGACLAMTREANPRSANVNANPGANARIPAARALRISRPDFCE
jgi:hypothetical protein